MEELIVIMACLANRGCSEASKTYYFKHPSVKEYIDKNEQNAKKLVSPFILEYAGPLVLMSTGSDISVKLNREFSVKTNKDTFAIIYKKEF